MQVKRHAVRRAIKNRALGPVSFSRPRKLLCSQPVAKPRARCLGVVRAGGGGAASPWSGSTLERGTLRPAAKSLSSPRRVAGGRGTSSPCHQPEGFPSGARSRAAALRSFPGHGRKRPRCGFGSIPGPSKPAANCISKLTARTCGGRGARRIRKKSYAKRQVIGWKPQPALGVLLGYARSGHRHRSSHPCRPRGPSEKGREGGCRFV